MQTGTHINLMEFKNYDLSDADEGGEDEQEDMEEEQQEPEPVVAAPVDEEEQDPKASEVLFGEGQQQKEE